MVQASLPQAAVETYMALHWPENVPWGLCPPPSLCPRLYGILGEGQCGVCVLRDRQRGGRMCWASGGGRFWGKAVWEGMCWGGAVGGVCVLE